MAKLSDTMRDRSRLPETKAAKVARRRARRDKSARAFLAFAFGSDTFAGAFQ